MYLPDIEIVKNKEAKMIICKQRNLKPSNPVEFLRYLIYLSTENTLLIKNSKSIYEITESKFNLSGTLNDSDIEKLSSIFLRFKPLFLAFKKAHKKNRKIINKMRRLAVKNHKPYEF